MLVLDSRTSSAKGAFGQHVALLFGFGIASVISGTLPDILADLGEAVRTLVH